MLSNGLSISRYYTYLKWIVVVKDRYSSKTSNKYLSDVFDLSEVDENVDEPLSTFQIDFLHRHVHLPARNVCP